MVIREDEEVFSVPSVFRNKMIEGYIKSGTNGQNLINAVDMYLKLNFYELYCKNNLEDIFKKAQEDKGLELKMFNIISKFILN